MNPRGISETSMPDRRERTSALEWFDQRTLFADVDDSLEEIDDLRKRLGNARMSLYLAVTIMTIMAITFLVDIVKPS